MHHSIIYKKVSIHTLMLLILYTCIISSCSSTKDRNLPVCQIDIEAGLDKMEEVYLSDFAPEIEYVVLETPDDIVLSDYLSYDVSEHYIIATDNRMSLVLFDLSGKFISRFGQKGRGPEEYQNVDNLYIEENRIFFSSYTDIFEFNKEGEFINKYPNVLLFEDRYIIQNWSLIHDSLIFGHLPNDEGHMEYKAVLINKNGELIKKYRNYDILESKGSRINTGTTQVYQFNGNLHFKEQFSDTLFILDDDYELKPFYTIDLGDLKMPVPVRTDFSEYFRKINDYMAVEDIYETENHLFLKVNFGNRFPARRATPKLSGPGSGTKNYYNTRYCLGVYNKNTSVLVFSKPTDTDNPLFTSGLYNDIDGGPRFFPDKMVNDSTMVMLISAKALKDHVQSEDFINSKPKYPVRMKELEILANGLNEADNPILMFVTYKE